MTTGNSMVSTDGERHGGLEQRLAYASETSRARNISAIVFRDTLKKETDRHRTHDPYQILMEELGRENYGTIVSQGDAGFLYIPSTDEGKELGEVLLNMSRAYAPLSGEDPLNPTEFELKNSTRKAYHFENIERSRVYSALANMTLTFKATRKANETYEHQMKK